MNDTKYATLNEEKLKELKKLEEKFGYTLVAYDTKGNSGSHPQS
ncbi:uroporphyrinogen-III decarboxylase [Rummeliibacillus sp. JY-2-4R]